MRERFYSQFFQEELNDFRFCRIRFTPSEIVNFVDASAAYDEFEGLYREYGNPEVALDRLSDTRIRSRVEAYNRWTTDIGQVDTAFCFAAFLGEHLESLCCGGMPERYEFLTESYTGERHFILTEILEMFPISAAHLSNRMGKRHAYELEEEQDVCDLLYTIIKSVFPDARIEEYTPVHAGSSKRIDIVVPGISTVVEIKYVRNSRHAKSVADELIIDFESYHAHADCKTLVAYVWDPERDVIDRSNFIKDLRGLRTKGESSFKVEVMIKP